MPNKTLISNFNAMEDNDTLTYDARSISTVFKNFFLSLAVVNYYSIFTIGDDFCLNQSSENKAL